ncbi:tRNA (mnm(5)s(2)U34)-methyltransferase [Anaerorhabdus sp.]|jgi:methylase of polypeptide subunit release factors|uniref:tRNA (mnm(5)s(2)U34)-methyltransferase n=1 Tax=Anaerorhabdus sp. TaxID=1872524 RepID=UPI002FCCAF12
MENINTTCHRILKQYCTNDMIAIDGTAGNGNDTYFLCTNCRKVIAYDVQKEAIENTQKRCKDFTNLVMYNKSHEFISELNTPIDLAVFNFGYLPHSDPNIITKPESSLKAIDAAYTLLKENGIMSLSCYIGHPGGKEEHETIKKWLDQHLDLTIKTYQNDYQDAPILYIVTKRK